MSKLAIELKKLLLVVLALWTFVPWGTCAYAQGTSNSKEQVTKAPDGKQRTVSGTVRDEQGEELVGVPVTVGNGYATAITDSKGHYTLKVPTNACQLKFTYVGMKPEVVSLASGSKDLTKDVVMKDNNTLHDVVVTGIFSKARESYTGAVSTISKEELKLHKSQNLLQTLKSIDASLNFQVNNIAGSNPNNLPQINIRGNSSLPMNVVEFNTSASTSVNTPLVILDGFEMSLEKLMDYNDEEIESINILKDAAATAIYGSRGSNGVIVVTTRQPEAGKLRIQAEVGIDIEAPDLSSYDYLNAKEKLELENRLGLYSGTNPKNDFSFQEHYNTKLRNVLSGATTDWIAKPIRTGVGSHYNIRLEGGSNEFRWAASANYKDTEGAMKGSNRRSFNGSIQLVYTLKNIKFKNYTTIGLVNSNESKYGSFSNYVAQQPYDIPYDETGALRDRFEPFLGSSQGLGRANPLYDAELNIINKSGHETLTNNFSIDWKIIPDLTLRGQFGISKLSNTSDYFLPKEHSTFTTSSQYQDDEGILRRGRYTYGTGNGYSYNGNVTLAYSHIFAEKHQLYVGADYNIAASENESISFESEGYPDSKFPTPYNGKQYRQNSGPNGSKSKSRRIGFTANVNYTYDSRYYVDLSYRVDGSSSFGSERKWAPFWSTGIGWNVHNEKFFKANPILSILRLKGSIGEVGSQMGSGSGANTIYRAVTDSNYMNWQGSQLAAWGNPRLTWQTTLEGNAGLEFGMLKGRLKGEFNYYEKRTTNLLSSMDLPQSMGINNYIANIGEVRNRGWELSLTGYPIRDLKHDFTWMVTGQMVYNKNWISKLSNAVKAQTEAYREQDVDVANLFYEGMPQNALYTVKSLGIDPSTGKEIYVDRNGNVTDSWRAGDKVFCGQADPKYRGNFTNVLRYKGWTLNFTFTYYWGGYTYNSTLLNRVEVPISALKSQNVDRRALTDRWMNPGDVTFFKGYGEDDTRATSRFVMKDNVLELSSLSLQYRWDSKFVRKNLNMQSVTFGLNCNDLVHWGSVKQERGTSYPYSRNILGSVRLLF
ncbi:MAG: SusC/RagA family TonB-linked outer membrane protein [Bacteroidaceae bacterium]|nr:SusC/RagA family TonB-linked outer membrane protein [Bacteroidaceae bacterium]